MVQAVVQILRQLLPVLLLAGAAATGLTGTVGSQFSGFRSSPFYGSSRSSAEPRSRVEDLGVVERTSITKRQLHSGDGDNRDVPSGGASAAPSSLSSSASAIESIPISVSGSSDLPERGWNGTTLTTKSSLLRDASANEVGFLRLNSSRGTRNAPRIDCESFTIGNQKKQEFYSPNWPDNYPNQTDCVRVLTAHKGMLLKLDFRDRFDIEPSDGCRFDFLEVRDGQHGFAKEIFHRCGKEFPPVVISQSRYLWLRFHSDENIEYGGFKAVWSMIPRPTDKVIPEPESCLLNKTGFEANINSEEVEEQKKIAEKNGVALDCMWVVTVEAGWKIQLSFTKFKLQRPNECDSNFVDIFGERTDLPSRLKNFCGSTADLVSTETNTLFLRYYAEPRALNSTFTFLVTAFREKGGDSSKCRDGEFDCDDARCIKGSLKCNGNDNCRFRNDEEPAKCGNTGGSVSMNSEHIIIILVVFSLIMFGMSFAFVFNCVRKLIRDHRIIQEHIRQSRENRLDEIGRKTTPCPLSSTRVDSCDHRGSSESPSLEVAPSKELLPPPTTTTTTTGSSCALMGHDYTRELLAREADYSAMEINDIHRSNNASNATQERLQESSEEPETRDNACQTRESLFDGVPIPRRTTSGSHCSGCGCGPSAACARHSALIPPPPHGWSLHDPRFPEPPDYLCSYQRFQSPKPGNREPFHSPGKFSRQSTLDSGTTGTTAGSQHSSGSAPSNQTTAGTPTSRRNDPRYRAEAVIELPELERRPFSIESTKSAPDVIATH
ncbi:uncharacterized protein Neto [Neodiprion pinetum]|uniref:uncharacterized protein Neto n=1 Tax=Neodiprion pinetum TaxID=441929 RepID=UPI001EDD172B|nr:uncharacterized protein LOC124214479 [Neodiprion pinetum]